MSKHPNSYRAEPVESIGGTITVPGDKSISHRALMLGAIAEGPTLIHGFLDGEDCLATRAALEALGVKIYKHALQPLRVDGVGLHGLRAASKVLDLGNSGTGIRLMTGLLAGQAFDSELTGDASLQQRPMERVAAPLRSMGAQIDTTDGKPPLRVRGGSKLVGIDYALPMASAQVKSALLLAGLYADGRTTLRSPGPSRDHTERMLTSMGVQLEQTAEGQASYRFDRGSCDAARPRDQRAGGLLVGRLLHRRGAASAARDGVLIENVGIEPDAHGPARRSCARWVPTSSSKRSAASAPSPSPICSSPERAARHRRRPELVPLAIDEFPILFIAAAAARGDDARERRRRAAQERDATASR